MVWILNNEEKLDYSNHVNEIINELNIENNKIKYLIFNSQTIDEINQKSLINNYELFIIKDCIFLSSKQKIKEAKELVDFINKDENTNYILISNKKSVVENEINNLKVINVEQLNNKSKKKYIYDFLKKQDINLNENVINELISKTNNDTFIINNEIKKIKLLAKSLSSDQELINIISNYNNENTFDLLESIIDKNYFKIFKILNNLKETKQDEISTISLLSYQISQLLLFKKLEDKYNINEIQKRLNIQPFVVNRLKKMSYKTNEQKLIILMNKLFNLEINIKRMKVEKNIGLKNLLINISMV